MDNNPSTHMDYSLMEEIYKSNIHASEKKVNATSSGLNDYGLPKAAHCRLRARQHTAIRECATENVLSKRQEEHLHELLNCSNLKTETNASIQTLANRLRCSESSIKRDHKLFTKLGLIAMVKRGWKQTNTKILLVVQHLKHHKEVILTPITEDLNKHNNNTYICDVDKCMDEGFRKKERPNPKHKAPSLHIREENLEDGKSQEAQDEIQRAALQRGLSAPQILIALFSFQCAKGVASKGSYLSYMLNSIKSGTWREPKLKPEKPKEETKHGFPISTLNSKARAGETYWDVANRLRNITN